MNEAVARPGKTDQHPTADTCRAERISAVTLSPTHPRWWYFAIAVALLLALGYAAVILGLFSDGIGILGNNIPAAWGFPIINVAWWIDIGHGGLLIAAGSMLLRQRWQDVTRRIAENVALFAGAVGGSFAVLHTGRPQFAYFLYPYFNNLGLWPQWRSPLMWDFFGIIAFLGFALIFWYVSMLPDLALLRERVTWYPGRWCYGVAALGWRNSLRQWTYYQTAMQILAVLAVLMAISTIGISALDFAGGIETGYHSTLMPVDAIAAALASAAGVILIFAILLRRMFNLHELVTTRHLNALACLMLASITVNLLGYLYEIFMTWFTGNMFERETMLEQLSGVFAPLYWPMLVLHVGVPQALWWRRLRISPAALVIIAILVNLGIWLDHYLTIVTYEAHGFMPSAWRMPLPTVWDWLTVVGSLGLFITLMFGSLRLLPVMVMFELRKPAN